MVLTRYSDRGPTMVHDGRTMVGVPQCVMELFYWRSGEVTGYKITYTPYRNLAARIRFGRDLFARLLWPPCLQSIQQRAMHSPIGLRAHVTATVGACFAILRQISSIRILCHAQPC